MAVTLKGYTANYLGLSTDAKPTKADNNAIFRELDTGKRYYFTGAAWAEIPSSGGGGGGDVTSVNGKTGAVTLTASDVGAYTTAEADTLLGGKADKVSGASAGDLAGLDANGNLTDSGINAAVIPSTASTSNKLSTATDTANEDITATANSEDIALTDSADARVHDLKIYGKTEGGHSVGENGLTVTACGKNLFNINGNVNTTHYGTTPDSYYEETGQYKNSVNDNVLTAGRNNNAEWGCGQLIKVKPNTNYTISAKVISFGTGDSAVCRVDCLKNEEHTSGFIRPYITFSTLNERASVTVNTGGETLVLLCFMAKNGRYAQFTDIQMEEAAQVSDFEPYKGSKVNITTALPLRRKMLTVDLGDFEWIYQTEHTYESGITFNRFMSTTNVSNLFDPTPNMGSGTLNSDNYLLANESCSSTYTVSNSAGAHDPITDKTFVVSRRGTIYIIDNSYTDPAEFKAAVTGITLTYPSYCDEIDLADAVAITRLDSNGDVLATPVVTPLTTAEKAAFAEFRTFDGNTNVSATDNPFMTLNYVKNTDNGKALADVDNRIEETFTAAEKAKLAGIATGATANTVIDTTCTLTVAGWTGAAAPYTQTVNVTGILATDRPILDLSVSSTVATGIDEIDDWALISKAETGAGTITFSCYEDIPTTELTVNVKVVR